MESFTLNQIYNDPILDWDLFIHPQSVSLNETLKEQENITPKVF